MVEVLFVATTADIGASAVRFIHKKAREMIIDVRYFLISSVCLWGRVKGRKVTSGKVGNKKMERRYWNGK